MAVPRKGWREITVCDTTFYWRTFGTDGGLKVVVVTAAAFAHGNSAQQLRFTLDYDHERSPHSDGGARLYQRAAVAPSVVRLAIERAVSLLPPFTGENGQANMSLPADVLAEIQACARRHAPQTPHED
ncbi:MAG TPA: hypothetical protein VFQ61_07465 [Polyangiaceae bacterium]|nr:hypothetical protein [Polyangiaceae bacterium]